MVNLPDNAPSSIDDPPSNDVSSQFSLEAVRRPEKSDRTRWLERLLRALMRMLAVLAPTQNA